MTPLTSLLRALPALLILAVAPFASAQEAVPAAGEADPARVPAPPAEKPERAALAYVLVSWQGADKAPPNVTRTKEEARGRADQVVAHLRSKGTAFAEAAGKLSDDPNARANGGKIGVVTPGQLPPALDAVGFNIGLGQISDPIETPFGWVILTRQEIEEVAASHILLMYRGSMRAPPEISRSKDEARKQIDEILAKLRAGADFAELAKAHSDCPSKAQGGSLGTFGRGQMTPAFEQTAFALEVGKLSEVVETPFGFHIIRRDQIKPEEKIRASHILIKHAGSQGGGGPRSRDQALEMAKQLLAEIKGGKDFMAIARDKSECPSGQKGGDLGSFGRGQMVPEFEQAAFGLQPGQLSEIVETPFGFHIIKRTK